ncbi:hypothetical protein BFF94_036245 [Burkholderia catarinensis]|nr:hypothetical protein BFF94_036245 [Burkholderia catarinensis]
MGFDALGSVNVAFFHYLLQWVLDIQARYGGPSFGLLGLRFFNYSSVLAQLGEQHTNQLMDSLIKRMVGELRVTDRFTRTNEECLWLLLPRTNRDGLNAVRERLLKLSELSVEVGVPRLELRVIVASMPDDLINREDSELLMARLASDLG